MFGKKDKKMSMEQKVKIEDEEEIIEEIEEKVEEPVVAAKVSVAKPAVGKKKVHARGRFGSTGAPVVHARGRFQ